MIPWESLLSSAKHADDTFQAQADKLGARDECFIESEIAANESIEANEYLLTCRQGATTNFIYSQI